jgi:hypothetical protein
MEESFRRKIPYLIAVKDDSPFVFAGLWEGWKDPEKGELRRRAITSSIVTASSAWSNNGGTLDLMDVLNRSFNLREGFSQGWT